MTEPYDARLAIAQLRRKLSDDLAIAGIPSKMRWNEVMDLHRIALGLLRDVAEWQALYLQNQPGPFTKWDLTTEVERETLVSMLFDIMPAKDDPHVKCGDCGEQFVNWADHTKHFILPSPMADSQPGTCWRKAAPQLAGTRPEWTE